MVDTGPGLIATGAAALLFAAMFLFGRCIQLLGALSFEHRSVVSFSAGMAAAYVFVHVTPELHGARQAFVESASMPTRFEGMAIYMVSLIGFLAYYGLDNLRTQVRESAEHAEDGLAFRIHVGGFAAYAALIGYLLVRNLEESTVSTALYTVTIALHFLTIDHSLVEEHGAAYERVGRWVLAAATLFGWGVGVLLPLPTAVVALLLAFVSGAIMMNSMIMELPSEKDGPSCPSCWAA
jgi:hypothetical protein